MAHAPKPVTIGNVTYESITQAAQAFGVDHKSIARRMQRLGSSTLSLADVREIKGRSAPVVRRPTKPAPMSWQFVYDQITSSPKNRSVVSSPAAI
jgi:hypothetical protein